MRIVHDIEAPAQTIGTGEPYAKLRGELPTGFRVSLTASALGLIPGPESEAIHIEGDGAYVLDMLNSLYCQVQAIGELFVEQGRIDPAWRERTDRKAAKA